jgi:hypothetical protein
MTFRPKMKELTRERNCTFEGMHHFYLEKVKSVRVTKLMMRCERNILRTEVMRNIDIIVVV